MNDASGASRWDAASTIKPHVKPTRAYRKVRESVAVDTGCESRPMRETENETLQPAVQDARDTYGNCHRLEPIVKPCEECGGCDLYPDGKCRECAELELRRGTRTIVYGDLRQMDTPVSRPLNKDERDRWKP